MINLMQPGLRACGYAKPGRRKLKANATRSKEILKAVANGCQWWSEIKATVFTEAWHRGDGANMPCSVLLCRLVVNGLLHRTKVEHNGRKQWQYIVDPAALKYVRQESIGPMTFEYMAEHPDYDPDRVKDAIRFND